MGSSTTNYGFYKPSQTEQFDIDVSVNANLDLIDAGIKRAEDKATEASTLARKYALTGEVKLYTGLSIPDGYLEANGQLVSRFSYPELFGIIGFSFGGSGSVFQLPDFSGRFPVGYQASDTDFNKIGKFGGTKTHTLSESEIPAHKHLGLNWSSLRLSLNQQGNYGYRLNWVDGARDDSQNINTGLAGGGKEHNNIPPYLVLKYIIKY